MKAYDIIANNNNKSPKKGSLNLYYDLIDSYCGVKKNFTIYSATSLLLIKFETLDSLSNEEYSENETVIYLRRGFKGKYLFKKDLVNLSFVTGMHVKGTHCDQRFISTGDSTGVFNSPTTQSSELIQGVCQYIFEGLNDNEYFESVKLKFHNFLDQRIINLNKK